MAAIVPVYSSFSVFNDGKLRPVPRDVAHEIRAVGVPMLAMQGESRFWVADGGDGSKILTWENFFLNADTNTPVNAQIRLFQNGDFTTRSNEVETVCRRVNPDDWDGDGILNERDASPFVCDGDFFGTANILPEDADTNAYCIVSVVATGPDALVTFVGDRPSNYSDPCFVAKSGVTNEVLILIGKTYTVSSNWPFVVVGVSDPETEVIQMRSDMRQVVVRRPVSISVTEGNPSTMNVIPANLGGVFSWHPSICTCSLSETGVSFLWNCPNDCTCCGCAVEGMYVYEGYWLPAVSCYCCCYHEDDEPKFEPASAPHAASVSASFSKSAVIFEDDYENLPGQWTGKKSTRSRLNIVANGGPNGSILMVTGVNLAKLTQLSGPGIPLDSVNIPTETQVSYFIVYEGKEASTVADDITVTAIVTDVGTGDAFTNESTMTSIRLELSPLWEAPENPCTNRHMYGVGEKVRFEVYPRLSSVIYSTEKLDVGDDVGGYELFDGAITNDASETRIYTCPISKNYSPPICVSFGDVEYTPSVLLVEPQEVVTRGVEWGYNAVDLFYEGNRRCWPLGCVGEATLVTTNFIGPMNVSFQGIAISELPCYDEDIVTGCFTNGHWRTHTIGAGAGKAYYVSTNNFWFVDAAGSGMFESSWIPNSTLVWKIPLGWHRKDESYTDWHGVVEPDYECRWDASSRPLLIEAIYRQSRYIDSVGTFHTGKFGHLIQRSSSCRVILDGKTIQWSHPQ